MGFKYKHIVLPAWFYFTREQDIHVMYLPTMLVVH